MRLSNAMPRVRKFASAIAWSMVLVLTGCQIPKLACPEPGPPLPPDFNGRICPETSAQLSVEEFFHDPVLTLTIDQALASNQELKILNQEVRVTNFEVMGRRGAYLPFVSLRAEGGLDKHSLYTPLGAAEEQLLYPPGRHFPDPLPNTLVGLDIFWQIDIWRELRNARDAARQRYYAAVERRNYFATRLVAEIAEDYYELLALDRRLQILDGIIGLQEQSFKFAEANKRAARGTELAVQRFQAEVRKNQSEKLIVNQEIVEAENRINLNSGRFPQRVERATVDLVNLELPALCVGVPAQMLLYRRDIQEAEREMAAAGLDVRVARARFFPRLDITGTVGYEAFSPQYLFRPEAVVAELAGSLVAPLINRAAIKADYLSANARQLQSVYNYQQVVLNAFTEVVNSMAKVENYRQSVELKKAQMRSLEASVEAANQLFQTARAEYVEVLLAQRDLLDARTVLVETKLEQLQAVVNAYQALGGGSWIWMSADGAVLLDTPSVKPPPVEILPSPPPPHAVEPAQGEMAATSTSFIRLPTNAASSDKPTTRIILDQPRAAPGEPTAGDPFKDVFATGPKRAQ